MRSHVKILRLISKKFDVNEHINNMSSYCLSFFEKLVICKRLKFSLQQRVSLIDVLASFEKAYWKIEPLLEDPDKRELASSTLRSIALNYIQRTSPNPPKALVKALNRLKKRDDIVITKPDKGSGVVVIDKAEYTRLLSAASINDTSKFVHVMTSNQNLVADHLSTFIRFFRKRKMSTQFYVKHYQGTLLIHFAPRVPDLLTFMVFPRPTKPILV